MSCPTTICPPLTEAGPRGAQGIQGEPGINGNDGQSAFTTLAEDFVMPAVGAVTPVAVVNSEWVSIGQIIYAGSYFKVVDKSTEIDVQLYLENLGYDGNVALDEIIPAGTLVSPAGLKGNDASPITRGYVKLVETLGQNINAGTFTQGSWVVRQLNALLTDSKSQCTLGVNGEFTLKGGYDYIIRGEGPAIGVKSHMVRLFNTTDNVTVETGTSEYSHIDPSNNIFAQTRSVVIARVELAVDTGFQLQHRCQQTKTSNGLGAATNFLSEIYSTVEVYED